MLSRTSDFSSPSAKADCAQLLSTYNPTDLPASLAPCSIIKSITEIISIHSMRLVSPKAVCHSGGTLAVCVMRTFRARRNVDASDRTSEIVLVNVAASVCRVSSGGSGFGVSIRGSSDRSVEDRHSNAPLFLDGDERAV